LTRNALSSPGTALGGSVWWLSFAIAVPFVVWLLFGPSIVLVLINSMLASVD
jgi:hypothetical protein